MVKTRVEDPRWAWGEQVHGMWYFLPSVLWHWWLGDRKGVRPVKYVAAAVCNIDQLHIVIVIIVHYERVGYWDIICSFLATLRYINALNNKNKPSVCFFCCLSNISTNCWEFDWMWLVMSGIHGPSDSGTEPDWSHLTSWFSAVNKQYDRGRRRSADWSTDVTAEQTLGRAENPSNGPTDQVDDNQTYLPVCHKCNNYNENNNY